MNPRIIQTQKKEVTIQVTVQLTDSMLETEENIQNAVNEVGVKATEEALKYFDTDGSAIIIGGIKFYSKKRKIENTYESPYGKASVERFIYQTSKGGRTYCPLETNARIINNATPKFAKMISSKYSNLGATSVKNDLDDNHNRSVAKSYIQNVAEMIGTIAIAKEEQWHYETPKLNEAVKTISLGLDGTTMYITDDGYREAMVGTLAFYNYQGERVYTTYIAASPEYGKGSFLNHFEHEIEQVKKKYQNTTYMGIADGAPDNWSFLEKHTDKQVIDFYHATGYVSKAADALYGKKKSDIKGKWLGDNCHNLKHEEKYAETLFKKMKQIKNKKDLTRELDESLYSAVTYFKNNKHMMPYAECIENDLPIGSGITEAACKVIVKQRMCCSGMKWKEKGAKIVLTLRCLNYSTGRWDQFWSKINQYGVPQDLANAS